MAGRVSVTLKVLNEIRAELRQTNERMDELSGRADRLGVGLTGLATEVVAMHGTLREVRDALVARRDDRLRLDDHEDRIRTLEKKVG